MTDPTPSARPDIEMTSGAMHAEVHRGFVGMAITCPSCGDIMDCARTVTVDAYVLLAGACPPDGGLTNGQETEGQDPSRESFLTGRSICASCYDGVALPVRTGLLYRVFDGRLWDWARSAPGSAPKVPKHEPKHANGLPTTWVQLADAWIMSTDDHGLLFERPAVAAWAPPGPPSFHIRPTGREWTLTARGCGYSAAAGPLSDVLARFVVLVSLEVPWGTGTVSDLADHDAAICQALTAAGLSVAKSKGAKARRKV